MGDDMPTAGEPSQPSPVDGGWQPSLPRRVHPVTPVVRAIRMLPAFAAFVVLFGVNNLRGLGYATVPLLIVGALALAFGVSYLAWTRYSFWFDTDGDLRIRSGVVTQNERRVQVSRLQAVDVNQPLLARLFGLAAVSPEVAGSSAGDISISYLSYDDAQRLRAELLARSAGMRFEPDTPAPVAPEQVLVSVPPDVLLKSLVLQPSTFVVTAVLVGGVVAFSFFGVWEFSLPILLIVFGPLLAIGTQFLTWFGFTVAESPDGLRLRFGLTSHRSQTVPPGRVQAIRVQAPVLWRRWSWVRVTVNVASSSTGEAAQDRPSVILPVAPLAVARATIHRVLPGVDVLGILLDPAPPKARWRAPLQGPRLGVGADSEVFVARHGWIVPTWDIVPHARTQSVRVTQGPWQRWLGLASMHVDSTPGPVTVTAAQRRAPHARWLAEEQGVRARAARSHDGSWPGMQPAAEPLPPNGQPEVP